MRCEHGIAVMGGYGLGEAVNKKEIAIEIKNAEIALKEARKAVKIAMAEVEIKKAELFSLKHKRACIKQKKGIQSLLNGWPDGFDKLPNMVAVSMVMDFGFKSFDMLKKAVESGFDVERMPNCGKVNSFIIKKLLQENGVKLK